MDFDFKEMGMTILLVLIALIVFHKVVKPMLDGNEANETETPKS